MFLDNSTDTLHDSIELKKMNNEIKNYSYYLIIFHDTVKFYLIHNLLYFVVLITKTYKSVN